jgi:hypothetical protein
VAKFLEEEGPVVSSTSWTEEQQRAINDLYWMNTMAFWLNPRGPLADVTPAPSWWKIPENYKSKSQALLTALNDDVVTRSLEAPKEEWVPASEELKDAKRLEKSKLYDETPTEQQVRLAAMFPYIVEIHQKTMRYVPCTSKEEMEELIQNHFKGFYHVVYGRGDQHYGRALRLYEKRLNTVRPIDQVLEDLDRMDEREAATFDHWCDERLKQNTSPKGQPKIITGAPRANQVVRAGGLYIVEHGSVVRGFTSKVEAESFLGEQQTFKEQKESKIPPLVHGEWKAGSRGGVGSPGKPSKMTK